MKLTFWLIISLSLSAPSFAEKVYYKETETLRYSVESTLAENVEIRVYPASVAVTASGDGQSEPFRKLFNYISGANRSNEDIAMTSPTESRQKKQKSTKIAMTAPVEMVPGGEMMFFLPNQYDMTNAPLPTGDGVSLVEVPKRKVAAIRFSGLASQSKRQRYAEALIQVVRENGMKIAGNTSYLGYDSPFTLPWNKRHEIIIPVE